jgi:hypothetical protein
VAQVLQHLGGDPGVWPAGPHTMRPAVFAAEAAVHQNARDGDLFGGLAEQLRNALEQRVPVVLVSAIPATLDRALRALEPEVRVLARPDPDLVAALLMRAYPGRGLRIAGAMPQLTEDGALTRLTAEQLTLALRAPEPVAAVEVLARRLAPPAGGRSLASFPVPAEVRDAIAQMVRDLRIWSAGSLPWRDVVRGALLVGEPGSGKTGIARLLAREAGVTLVAGSLARWSSSGSRSSDVVREMRRFLARAAAQAPCIAFLDELDAIGDRARPQDHNSAWTDLVVGALLECLDGADTAEGVLVLGATNHLHKIDAALQRPGRFDRVLRLSGPRPEALVDALRWQLDGDLAGADLSRVAGAAIGLCGADLAALVRAARARARTAGRALEVADIEAGHAVVGHATGCAEPRLLALQGWPPVRRAGAQASQPGATASASRAFSTLPAELRGSSSTKRTWRGTL